MGLFQSKISKEELEIALNKAKEIVSSNPVVVFSKTYCGYCTTVKELLKQLGTSFKVVELDIESDGSKIQAALAEWTGQRTVPNVFIGAVVEKHQGGKLVPLLRDAGALALADK
ncbi:glutaredoxin-C1 [Citrus sinensis]|uniref:Glutaredoxin-C1 n=1 Tax=Citrus sinensis TaxID=2711 RepID=A0ACB8LT66_CITSI|nr:glutaredoxin-C1 [Citrus sinensis]